MKKIISFTLSLVMLLSVVGCSGGKSGDTGNNKQNSGDSKADKIHVLDAKGSKYAEGIKVADLKKKDLTIMMSVDWNYIESINKEDSPSPQYHATKVWKEMYGTDIKIETVEYSTFNDYLATAVAAGTSPDIIPANEALYPSWPAMGLTKSVEDYSENMDLNNNDLYNKSLMEGFKWKGKYQWAITVTQPDKNYIVFNKTKFFLAGEKTPFEYWKEGKWNWTQFVATAKKMTNTATGDYGFTGWGLFPYFAPYSMAKINDDATVSLNIDDPKYMRYMTEVYNFYQKEKAGRLDWDLQNWNDLFPKGKDAMVMTTVGGYTRLLEKVTAADGDELGIAPVPVFDPTGETKPISAGFLWGYSISAAAANPEGAAEYIRLESLISRNIDKDIPAYGALGKFLSDEEKDMLEKTASDPVKMDPIMGIGKCYPEIDNKICNVLYYQQIQDSVQSVFDAAKPVLQAEMDEFNKNAKK